MKSVLKKEQLEKLARVTSGIARDDDNVVVLIGGENGFQQLTHGKAIDQMRMLAQAFADSKASLIKQVKASDNEKAKSELSSLISAINVTSHAPEEFEVAPNSLASALSDFLKDSGKDDD